MPALPYNGLSCAISTLHAITTEAFRMTTGATTLALTAAVAEDMPTTKVAAAKAAIVGNFENINRIPFTQIGLA